MSGASAQESVQRNGTLGPAVGKRGRLPKRGARGGISRPVSNGPVAERSMTIDEGRTIASFPLMPLCTSRRAASAAGPLTTRAPGIGMALGPTLRTRQPRSGRMPSDPVPTGAASVMLENATLRTPTVWCSVDPYERRRAASEATKQRTRERLLYGAVWTHMKGGALRTRTLGTSACRVG